MIEKSEIEFIKNYIKVHYNYWEDLHNLGKLIFEEERTHFLYLKIKNKLILIDSFNGNLVIEIINRKPHSRLIFKLDWFLNILAKNDKVVAHLYEKI